MPNLVIDNRSISTPLVDIIKDIKTQLNNGKLKSIEVRGDNIRVTCPVHKDGLENKPSCNVYIGQNIEDRVNYGDFHCFTCGEKGPFYQFVAKCFNSTDEEAKNWLVENYSDGIVEYIPYLEPLELDKPEKTYLDESVLEGLEDFHPYMIQRKLTKEVCKQFEVKYDPKNKFLVFPVRDETGKLVMLTRRSVLNKTFIIDADKEKPVYLLYYLNKKGIDEAYICESQINALTCWTHGYPGVALFGTGSRHQYDILNKSGIRIYNLLFDGDEAGEKGIKRFIQNIRKDVLVNVIRLPKGKDVNDLSYDEFENLITTALNN